MDDADDIVQETLFRAWRSLGTYAGRSSFRAWLYRIATNRSIDSLGGKARQEVAVPWDGDQDGLDPMWLQPYPDRSGDPAALAEGREHIATAFVVAIPRLPPKQRAALLLKDVLGFSVADAATAIDTTPASINSALQRARASVAVHPSMRPPSAAETALRDQLIDAWQRADIDALTALMSSDIVLTMPPDPIRIDGPTAIVDFLVSVAPERRLDKMVFLPATANREPAAALYLPTERGDHALSGLMNVSVSGAEIERLTAFRIPASHAERHGIPETLDERTINDRASR